MVAPTMFHILLNTDFVLRIKMYSLLQDFINSLLLEFRFLACTDTQGNPRLGRRRRWVTSVPSRRLCHDAVFVHGLMHLCLTKQVRQNTHVCIFMRVCLSECRMGTHMCSAVWALAASCLVLYRIRAVPWVRFRWNVSSGPCCMQMVLNVDPSI